MSLLTLEEFRARVSTSISDAGITSALESAEEEILDYAGPPGDQTEHFAGGHAQVMLGKRASMIVRVAEYIGLARYDLDHEDYELSASGGVVRRLVGGPNPSRYWRPNNYPNTLYPASSLFASGSFPVLTLLSVEGYVEIVYVPYADVGVRKAVQAELVALDLGITNPGTRTSERIGEWTETFNANSKALTGNDRRMDALARLNPPRLVYWTGSGHSSVPGPSGS
jgi:hypothetical protein